MEERGTHRAVILAAGVGSRMRNSAGDLEMPPEKLEPARAGLKGMIRFHGRPFLDFAIQNLLHSGIDEICLVVSPNRGEMHEYYEKMAEELRGARIVFATQVEPVGTADALLAAEEFTAGEDFLVVNSDDLYPVQALSAMRSLPAPSVSVFSREGLARGNIPAEKLAQMALLEIDTDGCLVRIVEKPDAEEAEKLGASAPISMNCWHFTPGIFTACREIPPHPVRGELELPSAVQHSVDELRHCIKTVHFDLPVFDLTSSVDIEQVEEATRGIDLELPEITV